MNILMINKFLFPNGGSETYMFKLGKYLTENGHAVQYFGMEHAERCVGNSVNAYTSEMDFHNAGGFEKITYAIRTIYSAQARRKLRMVLDDFMPDVCHLNNFNYQLTPSIILEIKKWENETGKKCRIIMTAHDYQLICPNHMLCDNNHNNCEKCLTGNYLNCVKSKCIHGSKMKSIIGASEALFWKMKKVYAYIDTIICCSRFLKSKLDKNPLLKRKTVFLQNFIDFDTTVHKQSENVFGKYVLYFGRFSREKGIHTLINTCETLPDVKFVFAGTGDDEYLKKIQKLKNVTYVGFKQGEELASLISNAQFSVSPSECYENCPFSVMESQMCGTPVIGASIGGIPELIMDGENGLLFESGNINEFRVKILKLWNDEEYTNQLRNKCLSTQYNSIAVYYKKLMKIYSQKTTKAVEKKPQKKLNGTVIVTYRCNARCTMCNRYKEPSRKEEEISIDTIKKLPKMYFTNITGGEPFIREDLKDIVRELYKKSDRIVISTNGFFTERIIDLAKEFPQIGIRISIEGTEKTNNEIRGLENGFKRGYQTLLRLKKMGIKDIGFGMTVQDRNAKDLVALYDISNKLGMEFATASLHNSFYFVESTNIIHNRPMVAKNFEKLINKLLKSNSPKKWFRAYFNHGLINYIYGQKRLLPCDMSFDTFFIDPFGDVMPCNGTKNKEIMGNLKEQSWTDLWNSKNADEVRKKVRCCNRNCWMIGSVSPAMHKYIWKPAFWVMKHKLKALFMKKPYSMYENQIVRDLKSGRVTKEELDRCSTCEMCEKQ